MIKVLWYGVLSLLLADCATRSIELCGRRGSLGRAEAPAALPERQRAWLGARLEPLPPESAERRAIGQAFVLTHVVSGEPAANAGLLPGDVLLDVDGASIRSREDLDHLLQAAGVGNEVLATVLRDGKRLDACVALRARPIPRR